MEYVVIGGVNDGEAEAHELGALLKGRKCVRCRHSHCVRTLTVFIQWILLLQTLNLIPYNPSTVPDKLEQPTPEAVLAMRAICMSYGVFTTVCSAVSSLRQPRCMYRGVIFVIAGAAGDGTRY